MVRKLLTGLDQGQVLELGDSLVFLRDRRPSQELLMMYEVQKRWTGPGHGEQEMYGHDQVKIEEEAFKVAEIEEDSSEVETLTGNLS